MKALRTGAFQFKSSAEIAANAAAISRAVDRATAQNVRLLVFHECAACGYPPVETPDINAIDCAALEAVHEYAALSAQKHDMYIVLGTIRREGELCYNTMRVFSPGGGVFDYDKRAIWGWDSENFTRGSSIGIIEIDGVKIGLRICFEVRFPELFRELMEAGAEHCIVSFSDTSEEPSPERYGIIRSHLVTRAVENVMTVVSVNSASRHQTAPTAVFDSHGRAISEAASGEEQLLIFDYTSRMPSFGQRGIIENARLFRKDAP